MMLGYRSNGCYEIVVVSYTDESEGSLKEVTWQAALAVNICRTYYQLTSVQKERVAGITWYYFHLFAS